MVSFSWKRRLATCLAGLTLAVAAVTQASAADDKLAVYVGTYTGKSQGIYQLELDLASGKLTQKSVAGGVKNPSFVAIHPNGNFLYSVAEIADFEGKAKQGGIAAFAIDGKTGALTMLNQQSSVGDGPCHLVVDRSGKCVLAANYGGGSVCCLPIGADGKLTKATSFFQHEGRSIKPNQTSPHAHSINVDANNNFAVAADLGLDKMLVYKLDAAAGKMTPNDPPSTSLAAGSGPRHFAFHPNGKFAYVINEINLTATAFSYDSGKGTLTEIQTLSTLPPGQERGPGMSTAEIQVHPSGKFVYGSNRGHDTIVAYSVDQATGKLTHVENEPTGGKTPRNFGLDPTGKYLLAANQASDTIVVFKINADTGALDRTEHSIEVPTPVCVKFLKLNP